MRLLLGAFGDPGHAFPMLALGEELVARGHEVCLQTWAKWKDDVERGGMRFAAAPEYQVFPTMERPLNHYEAAVRATLDTVPLVESFAPDACVQDILTLAPALAAELRGVPVATFVPHLYPDGAPGHPPFAFGARLPRTPVGDALWRALLPLVHRGLRGGRDDYNRARAELALPPTQELHGGLSRSLTMVATLPQLEYPRDWPSWTRVVGPIMWEPPGEEIQPPPGDGPVVLVAPSTAHDAQHALLRASLAGLAGEPVRVVATWNGREPELPIPVPDNAVLVPWLSYTKTMPHCDVVINHGGHGTLVRALTEGCIPIVCPAAGDQYENAARVDWAGVGLRLPRRLLSGSTIALAVRRAVGDQVMRRRVESVRSWAAGHDGRAAAAERVEAWAKK